MKNEIGLFIAGMFGIVFGGLVSFLWRGSDYGMFLSGVFYTLGIGIVLYWLFKHGSIATTPTSKTAPKAVATKKKSKNRK